MRGGEVIAWCLGWKKGRVSGKGWVGEKCRWVGGRKDVGDKGA